MARRTDHGSRIDPWIDGIPSHPVDQFIATLGAALVRLEQWGRVQLGDQAYAALTHQVIYDARIRFPLLRGGENGEGRDKPHLDLPVLLGTRAADIQQLREAGRFMITEFVNAASRLSPRDPMTALESVITERRGNADRTEPVDRDDRKGGDGRPPLERRGPRNRRVRPPRE